MSPNGVDSKNEPGAPQSPHAVRRRILQVCGSAAGGVRAHLADCARLLAADGHDVIVEAPAAVLDGLDVDPARAEALEIGPRPSPNDALAVARLRRLGRRADVVHSRRPTSRGPGRPCPGTTPPWTHPAGRHPPQPHRRWTPDHPGGGGTRKAHRPARRPHPGGQPRPGRTGTGAQCPACRARHHSCSTPAAGLPN